MSYSPELLKINYLDFKMPKQGVADRIKLINKNYILESKNVKLGH